MENPSGRYTLNCDVNVQTETLGYRFRGATLSHKDTYFTRDNKKSLPIGLLPPSRAAQKWVISYEVTDPATGEKAYDDLDAFIASNYSETGDKMQFTLYTVTNEDRSAVDSYMGKLEARFNNTPEIWLSHGHNKRYTFYFKTGQNYETKYKSFTFDPNDPNKPKK